MVAIHFSEDGKHSLAVETQGKDKVVIEVRDEADESKNIKLHLTVQQAQELAYSINVYSGGPIEVNNTMKRES